MIGCFSQSRKERRGRKDCGRNVEEERMDGNSGLAGGGGAGVGWKSLERRRNLAEETNI